MECPICDCYMRSMTKPSGLQWHCRGRGGCGLILRVQNDDYEQKLTEFVERIAFLISNEKKKES